MLPNPYYVFYIMNICLNKNTKDILQISLFHIIIFRVNILIFHNFRSFTAKHGLSEFELEDILSCDDDVLNDVYQFWTPPTRRLPPLLIVRLRYDLNRYLGNFLFIFMFTNNIFYEINNIHVVIAAWAICANLTDASWTCRKSHV